ncbi:MAG: hypothetical protein KC503_22230, partial [Myxococcales bacterium]|nr:hypothetical protein [Myxococcales bacterium]
MRFRLWVVAAGMLALLSVGCRPGTLTGNGAPDAVAADAPGASDAGQLPPADGAPPTSDSAAPADGAPQPPADNGAPPPPPP